MAIINNIANEIGDTLLISISSPYKSVKRIISYTDHVEGETTYSYFNKFFRWSTDNKTYSDWEILLDSNLQDLKIDSYKDFWIQYMYEVASLDSGSTLKFIDISLNLETVPNTKIEVPCTKVVDYNCVSEVSYVSNENCCGNSLFNPYNYSKAVEGYKQLSCLVANIFGIETRYFRTDPKAEARDVVMREYSLYDVVDVNDLKINIPDNEFPTNELSFFMEGPKLASIEIHIVKSHFESIFGEGKHPGVNDYLYIKQLEKMYEIGSVSSPDDAFYSASYYKVMLVSWKDRKSLDYTASEKGPDIEFEKDELYNSSTELFGTKLEEEYADARKPNQYSITGYRSNDALRKYLHEKLIIKYENIDNNYTIVSKNYYDLTTINKDEVGIIYKYNDGILDTYDRSLMFWIRPKFINTDNPKINVINILNNNGNTKLVLENEINYKVGDIVKIIGSSLYSGIIKVIEVGTNYIVINKPYINNVDNLKCQLLNSYTYFRYTGGLSITVSEYVLMLTVNNTDYIYDLRENNFKFINKNWYGIVINISNSYKQLSLFIWEIDKSTGNLNESTKLINDFQKTYKFNSSINLNSNMEWEILGSSMDLTNMRLFKAPIEIEEQSLMLNQYVVKDTHLTLILDNAIPGLDLSYVNNPR